MSLDKPQNLFTVFVQVTPLCLLRKLVNIPNFTMMGAINDLQEHVIGHDYAGTIVLECRSPKFFDCASLSKIV